MENKSVVILTSFRPLDNVFNDSYKAVITDEGDHMARDS
jgi:hypothetical protein